MIVALLLLGAAYAVLGFRSEGGPADRSRAELQRLASDAITVLGGLRDGRGLELDADLLEAMHCASDAVPSSTQCAQGLGANLSFKLSSYLPPGSVYAVTLSNGVRARDVQRTSAPAGEAVAASIAYAPDWNFTFVLPDLSCYAPTMDVNATLLPIVNGSVANVTGGNAIMANGQLASLTNSTTNPGASNVTLNATLRPASGNLAANLTSKRATLPDSAYYGSCNITAATGNATVTALRSTTLTRSTVNASLGATETFQADLSALANVTGATLGEARLIVYEPMPGRTDVPDAWLTALNVTLASGTVPSYVWTVPTNSTFGVHPVVLSVNMTIDSITVQARLFTTLSVALANGIVPIGAPYRVALQVWMLDWH